MIRSLKYDELGAVSGGWRFDKAPDMPEVKVVAKRLPKPGWTIIDPNSLAGDYLRRLFSSKSPYCSRPISTHAMVAGHSKKYPPLTNLQRLKLYHGGNVEAHYYEEARRARNSKN